MIYDTYVHDYLHNRYIEQLASMGIHFGRLSNELNFSIEQHYLDKIPDQEYVEVKYPKISDDWISGYLQYELFEKLIEEDNNPAIHYNYSFTLLDRRLFSLYYYWLLSAVDGEARQMVDSYLQGIRHLIEFIAKYTKNKESWNTYLDIWIGVLKNIVETNNTYSINGVRFGDYINKQEYYYVLALLAGNKR